MNSNLDVIFFFVCLQTKFYIDDAVGILTNPIVEARVIVLPKCDVRFESVTIDGDGFHVIAILL